MAQGTLLTLHWQAAASALLCNNPGLLRFGQNLRNITKRRTGVNSNQCVKSALIKSGRRCNGQH